MGNHLPFHRRLRVYANLRKHALASVSASALAFAIASYPATTLHAQTIHAPLIAETSVEAASQLVMEAFSLLGTKYKFGGNSPEAGFDCSGFIRHIYDTTLGQALPRTSFEMSRLGSIVTTENLSPGDLVFFNTRRRAYSHVGIYIGEGRFIHSPSKGRAVEIVDMHDRYWSKRFNGAKRLLQTVMGPDAPHE
jgi:cell wall-associated NlpC family hydrolase